MSLSGSVRRHRIRMLIPLWGARYYEQWLALAGPSLLAPGNILHLHEHADFELVFLCRTQVHGFFQSNEMLRRLGAQIRIKTIMIDEFFPLRQSVSYSVPLTLAFARGIHDLGEDGLGTFVIEMNADFVLSEGSLAAVLRRIDEGYHIISAPSLRVVEHEARPVFERRLREHGDRCFSARAMMAIAERHLHQTVRARIINRDPPVQAWYYHIVYWRLSPTCLAGRSFLLQPLCFQVRRQANAVICPHDYGFLREYCPGGRYTAIGNSDELLMIELQARDSEAEQLEPAPRFASASEELDDRISTIVASAAEWSTAEHRRAFGHSLLFHSTEPPADAVEQLVEFNRQITRIVERLPPPLSATRHYHWLSGLHAYRAAFSEDGLADYPDLIKANANQIISSLFEIDAAAAANLRPQWMATATTDRPEILAEILSGSSAVVTLDGLINEVWEMAPSVRIFPISIEHLHSPDREMTYALPSPEYAPGYSLCIYLLIASLPHWHKLRDICDAMLAAGGQVRVVFREQSWARVDLRQPANASMLSLLGSCFDAEQYATSVALIPPETAGEIPPDPGSPSPPTAGRGFIVNVVTRQRGGASVSVDGLQNGSSAVCPQPKVPVTSSPITSSPVTSSAKDLTAVIPAHNRVGPCVALVRFLRYCGFGHRVIVADTSTPERAAVLRAGLSDLAEYLSLDYRIAQYPKLAQIARSVETPYIVLLPDDDILFPHAIEAALAHLKQNQTHVAAHGYSLRFGLERRDFDIYQVEHFIPTIDYDDPMWRYAQLMRRYQPHIWAVFRTEVYAEAMAAAATMPGTVFQELMFQIVSILKGPVARLPLIYAMRGMEVSRVAYSEVDPFQWLLKDAESFFRSYSIFRKALADYLGQKQIEPCAGPGERPGLLAADPRIPMGAPEVSLEQLLDLANASYLARCIDIGRINHAVRYHLGRTAEPVRFPGPWAGWSEPRPADLVRRSARLDRRYVWREAVLQAQPKEEIVLSSNEIERVETELDGYVLETR
jgi:glycosyltransferase domain-containing protein